MDERVFILINMGYILIVSHFDMIKLYTTIKIDFIGLK